MHGEDIQVDIDDYHSDYSDYYLGSTRCKLCEYVNESDEDRDGDNPITSKLAEFFQQYEFVNRLEENFTEDIRKGDTVQIVEIKINKPLAKEATLQKRGRVVDINDIGIVVEIEGLRFPYLRREFKKVFCEKVPITTK